MANIHSSNIDVQLQKVCKEFRIMGTYDSYEELKDGNVHRTYKVNFIQPDGSPKSYIVQNVNTYVFKNPVQVMENIDRVTEHIRAKHPERISLHFHHTKDRKTYVLENDDAGNLKNFWRLVNYIPSTTYNACEDLTVVHNAGLAFGEFQKELADFDAASLYETIPDFHNTRKRFETLEADVAADPCGKVAEVQEELEWLLSVKDKACTITDMYMRGELPLRVAHNDTKINNVLFERDGNRPIVVIDLDTVMPGLIGADFGDAIRFACNYVEEDCPEAEKAGVNMDVYREFVEGFLTHTLNTLTPAEINTLALSPFVLAVELSTRFLDDYILGDPYFKTNYPEHNLVRTRCQIALAKDMLQKLEQMETIVQNYVAKHN